MKGTGPVRGRILGPPDVSRPGRGARRLGSQRQAEGLLTLGRRSGNGLMGSVAAIKNANVDDYTGPLRLGETRYTV